MPTEEIFLSEKDIQNIMNAGYGLSDCTRIHKETGLRVLKNVNGRCFFLKGENPYRCILYPNHPTGCKFYPLIFDMDRNRCMLDKKFCKHWFLFKFMLKNYETRLALRRFVFEDLGLF